MSLYQWLMLFSVPTLIASIIVFVHEQIRGTRSLAMRSEPEVAEQPEEQEER